MKIWQGCVLIVAAIVGSASLRGAEIPWKVETRGDFNTWRFQGNSTFTTDELVRGLDSQVDLITAARPDAYLPSLVKLAAASLERGYLHHGFPECRVTVDYDGNLQQLVTQIQEGPRFRYGAIEVQGLDDTLAEFLTRRLQGKSLAQVLGEQPAVPWGPQKHSALPAGQPPQQNPEDNKLKWKTGKPADFLLADKAWEDRVKEILSEAGYMNSVVEVKRHSDPETLKTSLSLTVDAGAQAVIEVIEVAGAERHAPQEIMEFLGLRQGMPFRIQYLSQWKASLYESGRFADQEVTSTPVEPGKSGQKILVKVVECPELPLLSEPLNEVDELLLNARKSIPDFLEQAGEVRATAHLSAEAIGNSVNATAFEHDDDDSPRGLGGLRCEVIVTSSDVVVFSLDLQDDEGSSHGNLTFRKEQGTAHLTSSLTNHRLFFPDFLHEGSPRVFPSISLLRATDHDIGSRFRVNLGLGAKSPPKEEAVDDSDRPVEVLTVTPAWLLAITRQPDSQIAYTRDRVIIGAESQRVELDRQTGRLMSARVLKDGVPVFELTTGAGQLAAYDASRRDTVTVTEVFHDPDCFLSDLMLFVAGEMEQLARIAGFQEHEQISRVTSASRIIRTIGLAWRESPPSFDLEAAFESVFYIPPAKERNSSPFDAAGSLVLLGNNLLFSRHSPLWHVCRESVGLIVKHDRTSMTELERVVRSSQAGPLTCLAGAEVLSFVNPMLADLWARKGLERLDDGSIEHDLRSLTDRSTLPGKIIRETAEFIVSLPADDLQQLLEGTAGQELAGTLIQRTSAEAPADEELTRRITSAALLIWQTSCRNAVEGALRRHVQEKGKSTPSGTPER